MIENIMTNTYQWPVTRDDVIFAQNSPVGVHDITETTIVAAQVPQVHQMMKNMMMSPDVPVAEPVIVRTDATEISIVYYRGALLF